jgi:hypothetical protein
MVHHVFEDTAQLQAVPIVDHESLLDTEVEVEVREAADDSGATGTAVEAEDQRTDVIEDRNGVSEHVDSGPGAASVN